MDDLWAEVGVVAAACTYLEAGRQWIFSEEDRRRHRHWVSEYLLHRNDPSQCNTFAKLEATLVKTGYCEEFYYTLRMTPAVYYELLHKVYPLILKEDTSFRKSIKPEERLSLTLRYMGLGDSVRTLHQGYLCGYSSVLPIVRDTCVAIYCALQKEYLKVPNSTEDWKAISDGFMEKWNFPNVIGAVDGKHVRIRKPRDTGSLYYNYKHYFSVVLLAVVDSDYKFIFADCGAEGRAGDSRLFRESRFYGDICHSDNPLHIPDPVKLKGMESSIPFFFIGDDAFCLQSNMMKPFPGLHLSYVEAAFNYRICRPRRVVENSFGILASRFRIFLRTQDMEPEGVKQLTMAAVCLHNFLRVKSPNAYIPAGHADWEDKTYRAKKGEWRFHGQLDKVKKHPNLNYTQAVKAMRYDLGSYCVSRAGSVPWQNPRIDALMSGRMDRDGFEEE